MKKYAVLLVSIFVLTAVSACNTVEGVGKDVKGAGQAIENTATKTKPR